MKLYTKIGDRGETIIGSGKKVRKDDCLIEVLGAIDSLSAQIDKVIYGLGILPNKEYELLTCVGIQDELKIISGKISGIKKLEFTTQPVETLEKDIDRMEIDVSEFIRFSQPVAMDINEARVRTRRIERLLTTYLKNNKIDETSFIYVNRLSDYLFALAVDIDSNFK